MIHLKDNIYPLKEIDHERIVVRAILLDEEKNVILEKLIRDDIFGYAKYVETPGGGVNKDENLELALKREIQEELGYEIQVIKLIEIVEDYYNLIKRKNINYYYLAKTLKNGTKHLEEHEKIMFQGEVHLSIDKAIEEMKNNIGGVGELVKQRELPILELAKKMLEEENL